MNNNIITKTTPIVSIVLAPLFCPGERGAMNALTQLLENKGFKTFLPQRDGIESIGMSMVNSPFDVNMFNNS